MIRLIITFLLALIVFIASIAIAGEDHKNCTGKLCEDPRFNYLEDQWLI